MVPAGALVCALPCATGAMGRGGGALYTGRGPVCGTIMRGAGGCGGPATTGGAVGRVAATEACGAAEAVIEGVVDAGGAGGATMPPTGGAGRGGAVTGAALGTPVGGAVGVTEAAGFSTTGAIPAGRAGAGTAGAGITGAAEGGVGRASGGTAIGFATTAGGAAARTAGGAAASFFCVIAFSTSPGREMFDRSILVLISSSPRDARELDLPAEDEPSAEERMYARTFSASCSSRELECVFFSVTPTAASVSRIALLLTSSSRARSLIRTLLIRPFVSPCRS